MSLQTLLLLVASCIFLLPGTGRCDGIDASPVNEENPAIPGTVMGTCRTIAAILSAYPSLEVRMTEKQDRDLQGLSAPSGCLVVASGSAAGIAGEIDPAEAARLQLEGDGWTQDIRHAADGPGTTSFVFRKNGSWCRASGGAHSWVENGKVFRPERYELVAECGSDPGGAAPGR